MMPWIGVGFCSRSSKVRSLHGRALQRRLSDKGLVEADALLGDLCSMRYAHALRCTQTKPVARFVGDVDSAGIGAGELNGLGDDRVQHGLEVDGGVDRLADLAQRPKLLDRLCELASANLALLF